MKPHRFIITTSRHADRVRLSCRGEWGNMPLPSVAAAEAEARRIGGADATIAMERGR